MAESKYILFIISDTAPVGASDGWFWLNTINNKLFRYQGYADGSWVEKNLDLSVPILISGNMTIGTDAVVKVGNDAGITGSKTVGGYKITFKKGILTGFDAV